MQNSPPSADQECIPGWLDAEQQLQRAGLRDFDQELCLEHKLLIAHHGGVANLDCVLQSPTLLVGVESTLTETLEAHEPVAWKAVYRSAEMSSLLDGGWRSAFCASLKGEWTPRHLGLEQLIKHALALNSHKADRTAHLVYVYWEPVNAADLREIGDHRSELDQLVALVEAAEPQLHPLSLSDLLDEWSSLDEPDWIVNHTRELRGRYELAI